MQELAASPNGSLACAKPLMANTATPELAHQEVAEPEGLANALTARRLAQAPPLDWLAPALQRDGGAPLLRPPIALA